MSDSLSGGIRFDGIGSGTDFTSMIEQLKKIEEIPKNRYTAWKKDWLARVEAFNEILGVMKTSQAELAKINNMGSFLVKNATSSREGAVSFSASGDSADAQHSISVRQLAANAVHNSQKTYAKNEVINSSGADQEFKFTYAGGTEQVITLPDGADIGYLVSKINSLNKGVQASLIPSGNEFVFQLQGKDTGEDNSLVVSTNIASLDTSVSTNWHKRDASSAYYTIDNNPSEFKSNTNKVTDVIKGVTITLKAVVSASDPVTLTIGTDNTKLKENIKTYVDSTNAVLAKIRELSKVDSNKETYDSSSLYSKQSGSILTGNYGVQLLASRLKNINASSGVGFNAKKSENDPTGDLFSLLGQIGISMDSDENSANFGLLKIDNVALDKAIAKDPKAVAQLFAADMEPSTNTQDFHYSSHIAGITKSGNYPVTYKTDASGALTDVYINGTKANQSDLDPFTFTVADGPAKGLSIQFDKYKDFGVNADYKANIGLKQGKVGQWVDSLTAEQRNNVADRGNMGAIPLLIDNYTNGIVKNLDIKIEKETNRIAQWETRQRLLFARLETVLSKYQSQMQSNASSLGQLGKQ